MELPHLRARNYPSGSHYVGNRPNVACFTSPKSLILRVISPKTENKYPACAIIRPLDERTDSGNVSKRFFENASDYSSRYKLFTHWFSLRLQLVVVWPLALHHDPTVCGMAYLGAKVRPYPECQSPNRSPRWMSIWVESSVGKTIRGTIDSNRFVSTLPQTPLAHRLVSRWA